MHNGNTGDFIVFVALIFFCTKVTYLQNSMFINVALINLD